MRLSLFFLQKKHKKCRFQLTKFIKLYYFHNKKKVFHKLFK